MTSQQCISVPSWPIPTAPLWPEKKPPARALTQEQFGDAFRLGYPMTLRFLLSRGTSADIAEEVAQAAWAKGWEYRDQLQRPAMISAWVNSIAKNMLRNRQRTETKLETLTESATAAGSPESTVDLKRILSGCEERDAAILRGFYVEGYTTQEIAELIGLSPVAVRVRMLRLRNALRSKLSRQHPDSGGDAVADVA